MLNDSIVKLMMHIKGSEFATNFNLPTQINSNENAPLAILNFLSQNNSNLNLSFLENKQNDLNRLISFVGVLSSLNIQIKDLKQIHEILSFFQNVAKINNLQEKKNESAKNDMLFSQVKQVAEDDQKIFENQNDSNEKIPMKKKT
jgi:hypothetical protein